VKDKSSFVKTDDEDNVQHRSGMVVKTASSQWSHWCRGAIYYPALAILIACQYLILYQPMNWVTPSRPYALMDGDPEPSCI
jgi:hypothetical protein